MVFPNFSLSPKKNADPQADARGIFQYSPSQKLRRVIRLDPRADKIDSQSGITLLASIVILASVAVISFTVSILALRELKAARQQAYSEPAIVSAEAGAETALFFSVRGIPGISPVCPGSYSENQTQGDAGFNVCNLYYDDPYFFNTSSSQNEVVLLNDPANLANTVAGYQRIDVTATSSTNYISSVQLNIYDLDHPEQGIVITPEPIVNVGGALVSVTLDPNKSYAVFLVPKPDWISGTASGFIKGYNSSGVSKGVPSKNPKVESTGSKQTLLRKLQVIFKR